MIDLETITIYVKRRINNHAQLEALRAEITAKLELQPGDEVYFRYESKQDVLITTHSPKASLNDKVGQGSQEECRT